MSTSYSYTETATFTVTHARHMAAKVAADLKRMQRFYGSPSDERIAQFEAEVTELIRAGYLGTVTLASKKTETGSSPHCAIRQRISPGHPPMTTIPAVCATTPMSAARSSKAT